MPGHRTFALLIAQDKAALIAVAQRGNWTIIPNTGFAFDSLASDDDHAISFADDMDAIAVDGPGCLALAFRNE